MVKNCSPYLKLLTEKGIDWNFSLSLKMQQEIIDQDKLIFLHIGYVSNITIRESSVALFSDKRVQSVLNENFVCFAEDKEDNPESFLLALDLLFINKDFSFGPMNMFIMPDRKPIIAFSDCDPESFVNIAESILAAKSDKREKLSQLSDELTRRALEGGAAAKVDNNPVIDALLLDNYVKQWFHKMFESGFIYNLKPFTPNPSGLATIVEYLRFNDVKNYSENIQRILNHLQFSQLFDVVDGGFFRQAKEYSCDKPLFEKTLEENSRFMMLYALAYKQFSVDSYKESALLISQFILNNLKSVKGGLINSTTLLNPVESAYYYHFSLNEISLLFPERYVQVATSLGIDTNSGKKIKQLPVRVKETYISLADKDLQKLRERRKEHTGFFRDERVMTSANCIAVTSLAKASDLLNDLYLYVQAVKIFEHIVYNNIDVKDGKIYRYKCTDGSFLPGYLSDYALLIEASLELFKIRKEQEYLAVAEQYTKITINLFYKDENGMFSKSEKGVDADIMPFKREPNIDLVRPSSNSIMAGNLINLYHFTGKEEYLTMARQQLINVAPHLLGSGPLLSSWAHKILLYLNI